MNSNTSDNNDIKLQLDEFFLDIDSLMLATVNGEGHPEASYTPYVEHDGCYYIFVSELASHTTNLKQSGVANVLFLENQYDGHAYTRKRFNCFCKVTVIDQVNALFESRIQQMEEQFGKLIVTLRGLNDFHLFQLSPVKGNFVAGFGQSFEVDFSPGGGISHRRPN